MGGGVYYEAINDAGIFYLEQSVFSNNAAVRDQSNTLPQGGALLADFRGIAKSFNLRIQNCEFTGNSAAAGGAVAILNNLAKLNVNLANNKFENNFADKEASAFKFESGLPYSVLQIANS